MTLPHAFSRLVYTSTDTPSLSPTKEETRMFKRTQCLMVLGIFFLIPQLVLAQKYSIYSKELPNGLHIVVIENPVVPLVTIELNVRNGSYTEPPEYNGLSHLYEHMFFKANALIPTQEKYLERMQELGMSFNGTTGEERVNYFFTFNKDNLKEGLEFMRAAAITPLFLQSELERERPVVTGEYDRNESNPYYHLYRAGSGVRSLS